MYSASLHNVLALEKKNLRVCPINWPKEAGRKGVSVVSCVKELLCADGCNSALHTQAPVQPSQSTENCAKCDHIYPTQISMAV